MSKRTATDLDGTHTLVSNIEHGEKVSGPDLSSDLSSPSDGVSVDISTMTMAALKAKLNSEFIMYERTLRRTFFCTNQIKKTALMTLLVETVEARSKIPRLNEDVQGYIVSFLGGFDSLHMATQLARGFRLRAKPRLDAMLKRSDADIKVAAKAWCEDAEAARETYGPISI
ncbi:hypothetical protein TrVE_jg9623 [Triparma verrucosa]|uniref:Uncharacterized protein n=1 Tax=Triparma verrucosa TaxID=1606542 RepID=A0A9W7FKA3_9STRA|nr:hypothetical protein TrVE_jg9623 [Triparma verrucosa]